MSPSNSLSIKAVWVPFILQTVVLVSAGIVYAINQEHRLTVMEENIRNQTRVVNEHIAEQERTQELMRQQIEMMQATIEKLADLEEFFHGMSPDELKAFRNRRGRQ